MLNVKEFESKGFPSKIFLDTKVIKQQILHGVTTKKNQTYSNLNSWIAKTVLSDENNTELTESKMKFCPA